MALRDPEAINRLAEFINSSPLYSPCDLGVHGVGSAEQELPETILRECSKCNATPTWKRVNPLSQQPKDLQFVGCGSVVLYICTHCGSEKLWIWVDRSERREGEARRIVYRKLGQWPAPTIEPKRDLLKALSPELLDFFRKGLTSLSHGYGIGALAYFRRVVEDGSLKLIDVFAERAAASGENEASNLICAAKNAQRTDERLKAAAEALPAILRPGGVNPLSALYGQYSRGLHALTDSECLDIARSLYYALEYIFTHWKLQMEQADEFRVTVQQLADGKRAPRTGASTAGSGAEQTRPRDAQKRRARDA